MIITKKGGIKEMIRALGTGIIVLALLSILPMESMGLEKKEELVYADTAQLDLPSRGWPVLKLDSLSSVGDAYEMVRLEKVNPQKQVSLKLADPMKQTWIGLDTILIGKLTRDEEGKLESILGMSAGIGIAYRRYFKTAEEFRTLHPYWELGTMILLWPYGTLGVTYPIPLGSEEKKVGSLFCLDLCVGLIFPFPFAGIGLAAAF